MPKKFLRIKEITFILPDDFDGTIEDALNLFTEYRLAHRSGARYKDPDDLLSTFDSIISSKLDERVCGEEAIYELIGDMYHPVLTTGPNEPN